MVLEKIQTLPTHIYYIVGLLIFAEAETMIFPTALKAEKAGQSGCAQQYTQNVEPCNFNL